LLGGVGVGENWLAMQGGIVRVDEESAIWIKVKPM